MQKYLIFLFFNTILGTAFSQGSFAVKKLKQPDQFESDTILLKLRNIDTATYYVAYLINRKDEETSINLINNQPQFYLEVQEENGAWRVYNQRDYYSCVYHKKSFTIDSNTYLVTRVAKQIGPFKAKIRLHAIVNDSSYYSLPIEDYVDSLTIVTRESRYFAILSEKLKHTRLPAQEKSEYYLRRAILYRKLKEYDNTLKDLKQSIEADSNNYQAIFQRGLTYCMAINSCGDTSQAIKLGLISAAFEEWSLIPESEIELIERILRFENIYAEFFLSREDWQNKYSYLDSRTVGEERKYYIDCLVKRFVKIKFKK